MTRDLHEALHAHWDSGAHDSKAAMARALDMPSSTLKGLLSSEPGERRYRSEERDASIRSALKEKPPEPEEETYEQHGDTLTAHKVVGERVTSLEEAITFFDVDTDKWRVKKFKCAAYDGPMRKRRYGKGGNRQTDQTMQLVNYGLWVEFERAHEREALHEYARSLAETLSIDLPDVPEAASGGEYAAVLSIPDVHIGKYAWAKKSGAKYDLPTAEALFRAAVDDLLVQIQARPLEKIILPVGNDAAHIDGIGRATTAGTLQDTDSLWQHIAQVVARCNRYAIEEARKVAPVEVVVVPGNHDEASAYYQGMVLEAAYEGVSGVTIRNEPTHRKAVQFGRCLLLFDHGKEVSLTDLPMQLAQRFPEKWGATEWREVHTGHKHIRTKESVGDFQELSGVIVRISPALCGPDAWHQRKGFTAALRGAEAFLYHKEAGYAGTLPFNVMGFA